MSQSARSRLAIQHASQSVVTLIGSHEAPSLDVEVIHDALRHAFAAQERVVLTYHLPPGEGLDVYMDLIDVYAPASVLVRLVLP